tara:strand:- start:19 stop:600 length:582 start_codon:yes stop_codon:yes gene_type:complete
MSFEVANYELFKNALPRDVVDFLYIYTNTVREAVSVHVDNDIDFSHLGIIKDREAELSFGKYKDPAMETLLKLCKPFVENATGLSLVETYSYYRVYSKGETLRPHTDRPSCEISVTICLGGDPWDFIADNTDISMSSGDLIVYRGQEVMHYREEFKGNQCSQVFLHYNDLNGPHGDSNKYDKCEGLMVGKNYG